MAEKHEIEIIITPDGEVKLEVHGVKGPACAPIVKNLADKVGETKATGFNSEYYEKSQQTIKKQQGG